MVHQPRAAAKHKKAGTKRQQALKRRSSGAPTRGTSSDVRRSAGAAGAGPRKSRSTRAAQQPELPMDPSASGVLVGAASALACGVACVSARPPSERQIEAEIMRNVRVVEPSSGEHKLTILLLPGFTGSVEELIPWFQRLGEPLDTRSAAAKLHCQPRALG